MDKPLGPFGIGHPEDRTELRDYLMPDIEVLAVSFKQYTKKKVKRVEVLIIDEDDQTRQINFIVDPRLPR